MSHTLSIELLLQNGTLEQQYAFPLLGRHQAIIYTK